MRNRIPLYFKYPAIIIIFIFIFATNGFSAEEIKKKYRFVNNNEFNTYLKGGSSIVDSISDSFDRKVQYSTGIGTDVLFSSGKFLMGLGAEILYMFKSNTIANYYYEPYYAIGFFADAGVRFRLKKPAISILPKGGIKFMSSSFSSSIAPELGVDLIVTHLIKKSIGFSIFYIHTFHPDFETFETVGLKIINTWGKK